MASLMTDPAAADPASPPPYRVLARKYRPTTFEDLIGQGAMVRTLSNAIDAGRLAHAFVMTGVRGVGKTTTARIIARALNCIGADGTGGPTIQPCGVCANCTQIAEDRHPDVIEMDAASRTGVNDIRELIDGVRYLPVQARFKIYIVDEVHMLSTQAFNALLKTLEEPPEHVKFIFATTEIRKVPVTVLSRCQRFDLRRIEFDELVAHLAGIARAEHADIGTEALGLIARAAEGSVRDALSMMDQAIAHGGGTVDVDQVRDMLGMADRGRVIDLFEHLMAGRIVEALDEMQGQYDGGTDPAVILSDLLEVSHLATRFKVAPGSGAEGAMADAEAARVRALAEGLGVPHLSRAWQILLKGLEETQRAPQPRPAAEMALIRLAHAAQLPTPGDLVKKLSQGGAPAAAAPTAAPASQPAAPVAQMTGTGAVAVPAPAPVAAPAAAGPPTPQSLADVAALLRAVGKPALAGYVRGYLHPVSFDAARLRIEVRPADRAPADLIPNLTQALRQHTDRKWVVAAVTSGGEETLAAQDEARAAAQIADAEASPMIGAIKAVFPDAKVTGVEPLLDEAADEPVPLDPDAPDDDET